MLSRHHGSRAFTLVELIVVLVVLGVLAALAIPTFAAVKKGSSQRLAETTAQSLARDANAIEAADPSKEHLDANVETAAVEAGLSSNPSYAWDAASNTVYAYPGTSYEGSAVVDYDTQTSDWKVAGPGTPGGGTPGGGTPPVTDPWPPTSVIALPPLTGAPNPGSNYTGAPVPPTGSAATTPPVDPANPPDCFTHSSEYSTVSFAATYDGVYSMDFMNQQAPASSYVLIVLNSSGAVLAQELNATSLTAHPLIPGVTLAAGQTYYICVKGYTPTAPLYPWWSVPPQVVSGEPTPEVQVDLVSVPANPLDVIEYDAAGLTPSEFDNPQAVTPWDVSQLLDPASLQYTVASGSFPPGVSMDPGTGVITGPSAWDAVEPDIMYPGGACAGKAGKLYCLDYDHSLGAGFAAVVEELPGVTGAIAASADNGGGCAVLTGGSVKCWGANDAGQLGNGTLVDAMTNPVFAGVSDAVDVGYGYKHACALKTDGTVWCWGAGPLGDGLWTGSPDPVQVSGITDAVSLTVGSNNNCVRTASGLGACWGANYDRQVLAPGGTTSADWPYETFFLTPTPVMDTAVFPATGYTVIAGVQDILLSPAGTNLCVKYYSAIWSMNVWGCHGWVNWYNSAGVPTEIYDASTVLEVVPGEEGVCRLLWTGSVICDSMYDSYTYGGADTDFVQFSHIIPGRSFCGIATAGPHVGSGYCSYDYYYGHSLSRSFLPNGLPSNVQVRVSDGTNSKIILYGLTLEHNVNCLVNCAPQSG